MHALELRGLRKAYNNGFEAVKGIELSVEEGDFFALLGPNGAGKSTIIGIITSLVNKTAGSVKVFGADLDHEPMKVKRYLGLVPQEFNFNMFEPVEEVVLNQAGYYGVAPAEAQERAEESLKKLGLWEKRRTMARALSGGMKRRLMIARALVHDPRLLILDEPTAGVDIELRRSMWQYLREVNRRGTTIILTTHYLEEAEQLCRNVAIIDHGHIIENTSIKALINRLDRETLILDLQRPLQRPPALKHYACTLSDEQTLEVEVHREQGINALFDELKQHGIEVSGMRNKANRLEELFLDLVESGVNK
ncbi:MAG: ABC transporter ATP-binding protein [Gammaproteobacteria bacterium]|nr:ABC transporter ATP-binding protein [Gammaproteobacteria bacterium]MCW8840591.1 ABC transporter ATP-binding protein [Gammaproteobacteria bacterium]MCW8928095.1 ABC transporter ATP-binding protein [Gammaproteobacteria bacterium]MCW8958386.1 ABC transporter ATP-binding protein [Gammaproteobacteria bacterium]MCW8972798.1 ABC transporter ATP-binding protein [Gammaproteobacteria bacterium]